MMLHCLECFSILFFFFCPTRARQVWDGIHLGSLVIELHRVKVEITSAPHKVTTRTTQIGRARNGRKRSNKFERMGQRKTVNRHENSGPEIAENFKKFHDNIQ